MMDVDPTCRFCQRRMKSSGQQFLNYGQPNQVISAYLYLCTNCHSEQSFKPNGQTLEYDFIIQPYRLIFCPTIPKFIIALNAEHFFSGASFSASIKGKPIMELNFIPNLTPQNTTLNKIKTLILFS